MADKKLSQLTAMTGPVQLADTFYGVRGGESRKILGSQFFLDNLLAKSTQGTVRQSIAEYIGASGFYSHDFGTVGDDSTDDTVAMQAAYDACKAAKKNLLLTTGTYKLTAAIVMLDTDAMGENEFIPSIIAVGNVAIHQTNDAAFAFKLRARVGASAVLEMYQWEMSNIKIYAKNGISFNQAMVAGPEWGGDGTGQVFIVGPTFRNVTIAGTYGPGVDPNWDSAIIPTHDELAGYGIGIRLSKVFDAKINGGWFYGIGIAIGLYGTDITGVNLLRFQSNARHLHNRGMTTYGSETKLDQCDILANYRQYGIYNDHCNEFRSVFCFYENPSAQSFFYEDRSFQSSYINNSFNDLPNETRPWCTLAPVEHVKFHGNRWTGNGQNPPCEVLTTAWTKERPFIAEFLNNEALMPTSRVPGVRTSPLNPYIFSSDNFDSISGAIALSYPWEQDGTRWVIKEGPTSFVLAMRVPVLPARFTVRITAKCRAPATPPVGGMTLVYVPQGGTYPADQITIYGGGLDFSSDTDYETKDFLFDAPAVPGVVEGGEFVATMSNDTLMIASFEIIPFNNPTNQRVVPETTHPWRSRAVQGPTRFTNDETDHTVPTDPERPVQFSNPLCPNLNFVGLYNPTVGVTPIFTYGWHIPIHAGDAFRSGVALSHGAGIFSWAARQDDLEIISVGIIRVGHWSDDPVVNHDAVFTEYARMEAGKIILGLEGQTSDGSKLQVYGNVGVYTGSIFIRTPGEGVCVKAGANCKTDNGVVLVAGNKTVTNTKVTAQSLIIPVLRVPGGTPGVVRPDNIVPGVSFDLISTNNLDTSTYSYYIVEQV